ncbi:MAG: hypothetical protein A2161_22295 [Candidatus Schekmanbacteria bacterium RBG_13_48_7]|uniref:Uncharacterized protein n=1 Tax=Candidatus Schekmanbacteria bacterium RBG_13_48_7 TaxID=1817878 RepID=A0A1F7RYL2_9BACT|nr:MAG: hypothetical protein A2161_22295 [Candidatus Schekmanbacteria bacterium RBG_13_48_7]
MKKKEDTDTPEKSKDDPDKKKKKNDIPLDKIIPETNDVIQERITGESETEDGSQPNNPEHPLLLEVQESLFEEEKSHRIDLISAFALIFSVLACIFVIKIYMNMNPNIENESEIFMKTQQRFDQLNLEIARLEKQTLLNYYSEEVDDLTTLMNNLDSLKNNSNTEIIDIAKKVQNEISILLTKLKNKNDEPKFIIKEVSN